MPDSHLTRAQMAAILVRAFGSAGAANLENFTDVAPDAWYYDELGSAVHMGFMNGDNGNTIRPDSPITRQEVCVVLANAFMIEPGTEEDVLNYTDKDQIASWALPSVAGMVKANLMKGDGSNLSPTSNISRKDFAVLMDSLLKEYITDAGTYTETNLGSVMVNVSGVTLKDRVIEGDLIIGDGVGDGEIFLDNVEIMGRLIVRGGGLDTITLKGNCSVPSLSVGKVVGNVRLSIQDTTTINKIQIEEDIKNVVIEGSVDNIEVESNSSVELGYGSINKVVVLGENTELTLDKDSTVTNLEVDTNATDTVVEVKKDASITNVIVNGQDTALKGDGEVTKVEVKANDVTINTYNTNVSVDKDVTGTTTFDKEYPAGNVYVTTKPSTGGNASGGGSNGGGPSHTEYTVTFDTNGGSIVSDITTVGGKLSSLPKTPTKEGYTFKGWFTSATGDTAVTTDTVFTAHTTVYAQWEKIVVSPTEYIITFDTNGGTTVSNITTTSGKLAVLPEAPTKDGYTFTGWFTAATGGSAVTTETVFTTDTTVYAQWEEIVIEEDIIDTSDKLVKAIKEALPGETVTLGADIVLTSKIHIGKNITIDGDNHTLTTAGDNYFSMYRESADDGGEKFDINIKNLTVDGDRAFHVWDGDTFGGQMSDTFNATISFENVSVLGSTITGINCGSSSDVTFTDCEFSVANEIASSVDSNGSVAFNGTNTFKSNAFPLTNGMIIGDADFTNEGTIIVDDEKTFKKVTPMGGTIQLTDDITLTSKLHIGNDITIEGDDHTITTNGDNYFSMYREAADDGGEKFDINIKNLTVDGDRAFHVWDGDTFGGQMSDTFNATISFENVSVLGSTITGINCGSSSDVTFTDCEFSVANEIASSVDSNGSVAFNGTNTFKSNAFPLTNGMIIGDADFTNEGTIIVDDEKTLEKATAIGGTIERAGELDQPQEVVQPEELDQPQEVVQPEELDQLQEV